MAEISDATKLSIQQQDPIVQSTISKAATPPVDLTTLSPAELIARINDLESRLRSTTAQLTAFASAKKNDSTSSDTNTALSPSRPLSLPSATPVKTKKKSKPFDFSRYTTRHIALKFAYLGHRYNGYEHANGSPPPSKPTIEEALWKALRKVRLIDPAVPAGCDDTFEVEFDEARRKSVYERSRSGEDGVKLEIEWGGYSKCGRTDKGVSAFGQVVGVRVRSNRPKQLVEGKEDDSDVGKEEAFDGVKDELPYITLLNSVLPPDIRILAWCPEPGADFDARFSCKERRYKYFFTNPAFCPTSGIVGLRHASGKEAPVREGWLDIGAMKNAAKRLEGLHDFRNLCKLDASKQMSSCVRRITFADIEEMPDGMGLHTFVTDPTLTMHNSNDRPVMNRVNRAGDAETSNSADLHGPKVYAFAVHGTAFLWHQVRCMVAVLFLVGQGLEQPELVDELLDIRGNPGKPQYELADDAPLVLWDCVFPGDGTVDEPGVKWIYAGDEANLAEVKKGEGKYDGKFGFGGLVTDLWTEWREAKMKETLTAGLLGLALTQGDGTSLERGGFRAGVDIDFRSQRVFAGANSARNVGDYIAVMQRPRLETLEVQNVKYSEGRLARRELKRAKKCEDHQEVTTG